MYKISQKTVDQMTETFDQILILYFHKSSRILCLSVRLSPQKKTPSKFSYIFLWQSNDKGFTLYFFVLIARKSFTWLKLYMSERFAHLMRISPMRHRIGGFLSLPRSLSLTLPLLSLWLSLLWLMVDQSCC